MPVFHAIHMYDMCYIYHDSTHLISLYRRVFDFTVSNVSYVSMLYFSRDCTWHVYRHVIVSSVRNQAMYTLWWISREIGHMQNEHRKCSIPCLVRQHVLVTTYEFACLQRSCRQGWRALLFVSVQYAYPFCIYALNRVCGICMDGRQCFRSTSLYLYQSCSAWYSFYYVSNTCSVSLLSIFVSYQL